MARKPGAGRKPAKNEQAAALINALKFGGNLKTATSTSPVQAQYVWFNQGQAIMFDGIVAAGHPIPEGIAGYPHAALLLDALDNTDKTFTMTVRENGNFEISSDKFQALVPSLETSQVIPTPPDPRQAGFTDAKAFVTALEMALKVVKDTGTVAAYSSIKITGNGTLMVTNGRVAGEIQHGNNLPPVIIPRQFANAIVKSGKEPVGIGLHANWESLTIWFEDGSWFRTNLHKADVWPEAMDKVIAESVLDYGVTVDCPPKFWTTLMAVAPFADAETRAVLVRPGLVRTNDDRRLGAALEVADVGVTFDANVDDLLLVQPLVSRYGVGVDAVTFYGDKCRFIVVADTNPAPERDVPTGQQIASGDGWNMTAPAEPVEQASGGWGAKEAAESHQQPLGSPAGASVPQGWNGIPAGGLAGDPEYESERQGVPIDELVLPDDAYALYWEGQQDTGVPLTLPQPEANAEFKPSEWAAGLKDVGE